MKADHHHEIPSTGLAGLRDNWRSDLIASISVALVALPLSLGVALASGAPPMSGLIAACIGGIVTTFVRGSYLGINGPAAGLTIAIFTAVNTMADSGEEYSGFRYVLAAVVVAGAIQVLFGLLKMGRFGNLFPSSVIRGMLAAIGIIIAGKQIHLALGRKSDAATTMEVLMEIPESILDLNPFVTLIAILSLGILLSHPRIRSKIVHAIPAPVLVLLVAVPLALFYPELEQSLGKSIPAFFEEEPKFIAIPEDIMSGLMFPDFSRMGEGKFWVIVTSITLVSSLITLLASKAVDKLDPYRRITDLNKDLIGVGFSTMASAMIGGLPITTVIVRSSVNVNHGARTGWSNFFHGAIILLLVLFFGKALNSIPLVALSTVLIYTGYKLASPKLFIDSYRHGWEQLLILVNTIIATLMTDLLWGILVGVITTVIVQMLRARMNPISYFVKMLKPDITMQKEDESNYHLVVKGVANFLSIPKLTGLLNSIPKGKNIVVDFSYASIVDYTLLETANQKAETYRQNGGVFEGTGLEVHDTTSTFPYALHVKTARKRKRRKHLTKRQLRLAALAERHNWEFLPEKDWDLDYLSDFHFFEIRPVEFHRNVIKGKYEKGNATWEITDVTFDEGTFWAAGEHHTTCMRIMLPTEIPEFVVEKEGFFDKIMQLIDYQDIDFHTFTQFSKRFVVKARDEDEISEFFNEDRITYFENEPLFHIESNGNAVLIFKYLRNASSVEILEMERFAKRLVAELVGIENKHE